MHSVPFMGLRDGKCSQFQSHAQRGGEPASALWPHSLLKCCIKKCSHSKWLPKKTGNAPDATVRQSAAPQWWAITLWLVFLFVCFLSMERLEQVMHYRSASSSHWLSRRQSTTDGPSDSWKTKTSFFCDERERCMWSCVNVFSQGKLCIALDVHTRVQNTSRVTASTLLPSSLLECEYWHWANTANTVMTSVYSEFSATSFSV